jgi:hypothetical protein
MAEVFINKSNEIGDSKRLFRLSDNDVFSINDVTIEFEKGKFYEVKEFYSGIFSTWKRTGKEFSVEELNDLTM